MVAFKNNTGNISVAIWRLAPARSATTSLPAAAAAAAAAAACVYVCVTSSQINSLRDTLHMHEQPANIIMQPHMESISLVVLPPSWLNRDVKLEQSEIGYK